MLTNLKYYIKTERIHPHTKEVISETLCGWVHGSQACTYARAYKQQHKVTTIVYDHNNVEQVRYTQKQRL